jgi:hypothetical protein
MSGGYMQTSNFQIRHGHGRLFRRVIERISIGRVVDRFQRALLYLDLFGPTSCAIISLLLLISSFQQVAHSGAEKGVI